MSSFKPGDVVYWNDGGVYYKVTIEHKSQLYKGYWWVSSKEFSGNKAVLESQLTPVYIYESPLWRALK